MRGRGGWIVPVWMTERTDYPQRGSNYGMTEKVKDGKMKYAREYGRRGNTVARSK